jgi:hypothetical protein
MLTINDVSALASRPERAHKTVLTVYLDVDQSQQSNLNLGFEKHLKEMLAGTRDTILDNGELKAFQLAFQRVEDFIGRYSLGARGLVMVFDASDNFFWAQEVDFPIRSVIRWGREVFVQPLAIALDEYERVGIVLLDRANLRLFTMFLDKVVEHFQESFDRRSVRHIKTIGMDRLSSASHAQRRADEQVRLNLRRVAKDIDLQFEQHGVNRIILAGSPEVTAELRVVLPKRLESQVIGRVDLATGATLEQIRNVMAPIAENFERDTEEATVTDLVTSAAKSGRAVIGLGYTLYALNQHRIWQLVYAGGFHARGYECVQCSAMYSLETTSCSLCGSDVVAVDDVVERAVDHAVRNGARVEVIQSESAESALMNAGGIGAFLRTRPASIVVS